MTEMIIPETGSIWREKAAREFHYLRDYKTYIVWADDKTVVYDRVQSDKIITRKTCRYAYFMKYNEPYSFEMCERYIYMCDDGSAFMTKNPEDINLTRGKKVVSHRKIAWEVKR